MPDLHDGGSPSVTLLMVFVIQHTQSHQQMATQRKLDEILGRSGR